MPRLSAFLLVGVLALPQGAAAAELRYDIHWGGFHAAQAELSHTGSAASLSVRSIGVTRSLTGFALEAERTDEVFRTEAGTRKWASRLAVDFSGPPQVLVDELNRLDGKPEREKRPPVPAPLIQGSLDPLTALTLGGRAVAQGKDALLPVFDGRNRYDVRLEPVGPGKARATVIPRAGFRPKSLETWDNATFVVTVDPATALPVRIVSESFTIGTVISAIPAPAGG